MTTNFSILVSIFFIIYSTFKYKKKQYDDGNLYIVLSIYFLFNYFFTNIDALFLTTIIILFSILMLKILKFNDKYLIYHSNKRILLTLGLFSLLSCFVGGVTIVPSSSMRPIIIPGDILYISKLNYNFNMPVLHKILFQYGEIKRGDIVTFTDPNKPERTLVKRVIGVPFDKISYENKILSINGIQQSKKLIESYSYELDNSTIIEVDNLYLENKYQILNNDSKLTYINEYVENFNQKQNCKYFINGFKCIVPKGMFFMMGDNRDNSLDSRYSGFIQEQNITGKANYIIFNLSNFNKFFDKI